MTQYEDESLQLLQNIDNNNNQIKNLENQYTKQDKEIENLKKAIISLRVCKQKKRRIKRNK
jgi:uncharacterized coiled-coil protein SlyX